jgi:hypothetical protein
MHETHMHAWQAVFEALETSQRTQSDRSTHRMRQTRRVLLPVRAVVSHTAGRGDDRTQGTGCNNDKPTQGAPALLCRIVAGPDKAGDTQAVSDCERIPGRRERDVQNLPGQADAIGFQRGSAPLKGAGRRGQRRLG